MEGQAGLLLQKGFEKGLPPVHVSEGRPPGVIAAWVV